MDTICGAPLVLEAVIRVLVSIMKVPMGGTAAPLWWERPGVGLLLSSGRFFIRNTLN